MSFYVLKSDLNDVGSSFTDYANSVTERFGDVGESVVSLRDNLPSFTGKAATSIKNYFSDIHIPLSSGIAELAQQLCSDYFAKYVDKYANAPIGENDWGKLSEDELTTKKTWVHDQQNRWEEISSQLDQAIAALPGDVSLSKPNAQASKAELTKLESSLIQLVGNVQSVEATGKNAFAAEATEFSNLLQSISSALSQCKYDMTAYEAGAFNAVLEATGLREAFNESLADCEANAEKMIQNQETMYGELYQREALRLAEEQQMYDTWGILLGVSLVIVGVVATVATAGAATPGLMVAISVAGGFSAGAGAADVINRTQTAAQREERKKNLASGEVKEHDSKAYEVVDEIGEISESAFSAHGTRFSKSRWGVAGYTAAGQVASLGVDSLLDEYKDDGSFAQSMTLSAMQEGFGATIDPLVDKLASGAKFSVSKCDAVSAVLGLAQDATDFKSNELEGKITESKDRYQSNLSKLGRPSFLQQNAWATAW